MDQESLLGNETQLHWILKEIDKYKEHLKTTESTKGQALVELEKANNALKKLTNKFQAVSRSKQASIESIEAAKTRVNQLEQLKSTTTNQEAWQEAVDKERNQYKAVSDQLISAKQQLNNLKQDFDIAMEAKLAFFERAADAQSAAKLNRTKIDSKRSEKEDIELRIQRLRNANSEERVETRRLDETSEAINALRDQLKEVNDADMDALRSANLEVEEAKKRLEEMKKEETSVRDVVESLKQELENVKRDIAVFKGDGDLEGEKLRAELDHNKQQVQEAIKEKTKAKNHVKEMDSKIGKMSLKAEKARKKEEKTKRKVETLWREAQHSEQAMREAEAKLEIAQREVQEAKEAKELADDQIRSSSTKDVVADDEMMDDTNLNSDFESDTPAHDQNSTIQLTTQDFEALSRKVEEATTAADTKVATIMDQVETIKQKEKGIIKNLEKSMQENKEIQEEITKAQESAQVADAATHALETQLNRWRSDHTRGS